MTDRGNRAPQNPLIAPGDLKPIRDGWEIIGVLNPGVFEYGGRVGLVLRVAERPPQPEGGVTVAYNTYRAGGHEAQVDRPAGAGGSVGSVAPILEGVTDGPDLDSETDSAPPREIERGIRLETFASDDPLLDAADPRVIRYDGTTYLTSISDLRLAWSLDGVSFEVSDEPLLVAAGANETYGIEDARVVCVDGVYHLTYSAVSRYGVCVGHASTVDWRALDRHGAMLPPPNKDVAVFPRTVAGTYRMLHRPADEGFGGMNMWTAESPDLVHWGNHRFLAAPRRGMWDCARIGAGAHPIDTPEGWLEIYHGADDSGRYCLGVMLLDGHDTSRVLARGKDPIMEPLEPYEREGFFGDCIFTNGHVVRNGGIDIYYGASDTVVCGASVTLDDLFDALR